jgi:hypothetical protein
MFEKNHKYNFKPLQHNITLFHSSCFYFYETLVSLSIYNTVKNTACIFPYGWQNLTNLTKSIIIGKVNLVEKSHTLQFKTTVLSHFVSNAIVLASQI